MSKLSWFQPTTIDGTPRRAFFDRVPEAMPSYLKYDEGQWYQTSDRLHPDLCRAAVDRWARSVWHVDSPYDVSMRAHSVLMADDDNVACEDAHRLADALGIKP